MISPRRWVSSSDSAAGTISLVTSPCRLVSSSTISKLRAIDLGVSTMIVVSGTFRVSWNSLSPCGVADGALALAEVGGQFQAGLIHTWSAIHCPSNAAAIPSTTVTTMLVPAAHAWRSSPSR